MKIYKSSGYEMEKKLPTTLEDLFNLSQVEYDQNGEKKDLFVTYVRYFDQYLQENGIFKEEEHGIPFYHIAALLILIKNNGHVDAERLYFNDTDKFLSSFNKEDIDEAISIYKSIN